MMPKTVFNKLPKNIRKDLIVIEKEPNVSLFPIYLLNHCLASSMSKYTGRGYGMFTVHFNKKWLTYLADVKTWEKISNYSKQR